jgi:predicted ATPase
LLALRYGGINPRVRCLSETANTLWHLGYPDQALQRSNEALALAQGLSHPFSLTEPEWTIGFLRQCRREACEGQEIAESSIAFSAEQGFIEPWLAWATSLRGWAIAKQGRHEEGIAQIEEGLALSCGTGTGIARPYYMCQLAEAYMEAGRLDDGMSVLKEALAGADQREERQSEAEIYRLKGELLLKQNNSNAAEAQSCFERAIDIARKQSAKSWELRATISLARLLASQGRRGDARALLTDIYAWFTEGFDTADLKDAKALLDQLAD